MSKEELRRYLPDSAKEISFIGSSIVRLSSAISGGLILSGHELLSIFTIVMAWIGHEIEQYFKLHEKKESKYVVRGVDDTVNPDPKPPKP
jgi:hypothetical protein